VIAGLEYFWLCFNYAFAGILESHSFTKAVIKVCEPVWAAFLGVYSPAYWSWARIRFNKSVDKVSWIAQNLARIEYNLRGQCYFCYRCYRKLEWDSFL